MITHVIKSYKVADQGEWEGPPLFWVKEEEEEMTGGGKASRASETKQGPLLSSRSGSATDTNAHRFGQV